MAAHIINGKKLAETLELELKEKIKKSNASPKLVAVQIGNDGASIVYLRKKKELASRLGIEFQLIKMEEKEELNTVINTIQKVCDDDDVHGIIIQLPLPKHLPTDQILSLIPVEKDVDGLSAHHLGHCALTPLNKHIIRPATPWGIVHMLQTYNITTKGKIIVVIGKSLIVGTPLSLLLSQESSMAATIVMCDRYTENIKDIVVSADVLVVAAGKHHLINKDFQVKKTCVMIDVGIHRINRKLQGDIDFEYFKDKCHAITPVPGGVGPMTVISLMRNVFIAYNYKLLIH